MSRCFPYPPQGYEKSAALIESIKPQKVKDKAKKERKKEKKRGKKEKSRGDGGKKEEKQHDRRKRHREEFSQSDNVLKVHFKAKIEDESTQLERSSLTEEQGPAVAQNVCDSSDSTQNSSKRRKHESAEISHSTHGVGLRIRLPLLRHRDLGPPPDCIERPCFSGRIETVVPAQREARATPAHPGLPSSSEQPCFSGRIGAATPPSEGLAKVPHHGKPPLADDAGRDRGCGCSCDSHVRRQYKKLIRDWNPPPLRADNPESDDLDWLLFAKPTRRQHERGEPGGKVSGKKDLDLGNALCSWPPRACYLPEAGVYALPYVVPY